MESLTSRPDPERDPQPWGLDVDLVIERSIASVEADLLVLGVHPDPDVDPDVDPVLAGLRRAFRDSGRTGAVGEELIFARREQDDFAARVVLLVGLGPRAEVDAQLIRRTAQQVARAHAGAPGISVIATTLHHAVPVRGITAVVEGFGAGGYRFERYRTGLTRRAGGSAPSRRTALRLLQPEADPVDETEAAEAALVEGYVAWVRDLVNTPSKDLTPALLAQAACDAGTEAGLTTDVLEVEDLRSGGFGGILAVGAGSHQPPRLIRMRYTSPEPAKGSGSATARRRIALVGKGITFDSGGLALKKPEAMLPMKSDMAGAATVLAVTRAVAALGVPGVEVIALAPAAENMPGGGANRPGDVVTHRNGVTSEVADPDCEGRLVLADALALVAEDEPDLIIDVATLTYACVRAVGSDITTALGNHSELMAQVRDAGEQVGELIWELPLHQPYLPQIASTIADLRNEGVDGSPGAIVAALFLQHFVGGIPWVHLDIGGTGFVEAANGASPVGGTGAMVRTLVHLVSQLGRHEAAGDPPPR